MNLQTLHIKWTYRNTALQISLHRHCTSNKPTDTALQINVDSALQMNLQKHCTSNKPTQTLHLKETYRHFTSNEPTDTALQLQPVRAIVCMWWFLASVQFQSISSYGPLFVIQMLVKNLSYVLPPTSKIRPIGQPHGMVQHNRCIPYTHAAEVNAVCASVWSRVSNCVDVDCVCACNYACCCIFLRVCPSMCQGYSPQPPEATAPLPQERRAGGQRPSLAGKPGQVVRWERRFRVLAKARPTTIKPAAENTPHGLWPTPNRVPHNWWNERRGVGWGALLILLNSMSFL